LSRAVPYGVYDITNNVGWVSVGTDHDTASFAVNAIRRWWRTMGKKRHPKAKRLMITADGGGSNGYRVRLWKVELQKLADELKLPITVCHLPGWRDFGITWPCCNKGRRKECGVPPPIFKDVHHAACPQSITLATHTSSCCSNHMR
jgi:hypothetical protein